MKYFFTACVSYLHFSFHGDVDVDSEFLVFVVGEKWYDGIVGQILLIIRHNQANFQEDTDDLKQNLERNAGGGLQLPHVPTGGGVELQENCDLEGGRLQGVPVLEAVGNHLALGHLV